MRHVARIHDSVAWATFLALKSPQPVWGGRHTWVGVWPHRRDEEASASNPFHFSLHHPLSLFLVLVQLFKRLLSTCCLQFLIVNSYLNLYHLGFCLSSLWDWSCQITIFLALWASCHPHLINLSVALNPSFAGLQGAPYSCFPFCYTDCCFSTSSPRPLDIGSSKAKFIISDSLSTLFQGVHPVLMYAEDSKNFNSSLLSKFKIHTSNYHLEHLYVNVF